MASVSRPLRDLGAELDVIVWQGELEKVVIVQVAVVVFVKRLEKTVEVSFFNVIYVVLPQEIAELRRADGIVFLVARFQGR